MAGVDQLRQRRRRREALLAVGLGHHLRDRPKRVKADELVADAEAKAERIIDDAIERRRGLNQAITSLAERRDEIADEAQRLADELLEAVDALRSGGTAAEEEPEADQTELEPPDQRETAIHETR